MAARTAGAGAPTAKAKPDVEARVAELEREMAAMRAAVTRLEHGAGGVAKEGDAGAKAKGGGWLGSLQKHGPVFFVWWTGLWVASGVAIYGALEYLRVDVFGLVHRLSGGRVDLRAYVSVDPRLGNAAAAVAVNEVLEVVRFPLALATTPYVTRLLRGGRG